MSPWTDKAREGQTVPVATRSNGTAPAWLVRQHRRALKRRGRAWAALAGLGLGLAAAVRAEVCAYQVTGRYTSTHFSNGIPVLVNERSFSAAFSNHHWLFEVSDVQPHPWIQAAGTDGSNVLYLSLRMPEGEPARWSARVEPGSHPLNTGLWGADAFKRLFVMLAPKSLYESLTNKSVLAPWRDPGTPPDYYTIRCDRMEGCAELPRAIAYEGPNYIEGFLWPHVGTSLYWPNTNHPPVLAASYQVTRATNLGNMCLPLAFEWRLYRFGELWEGVAPDKALSDLTVGTIDTVSLEPRTSWLPELPAGQAVSVWDKRFQGGPLGLGELNYTVTNGCWPATNDPVVRLALAKAVTAARYAAGLQRKRPWAWAVLALLALPPLLAYWAQRRRQQTEIPRQPKPSDT